MSKLSFWLVWAVGGLPVLLAILMYFFGVFLPQDKNHAGELLSGQHIESWRIKTDPGNPSWQLLLTTPKSCLTICEEWQHTLNQVHLALGKERDRVRVKTVDYGETLLGEKKVEKLGAAVWVADPLGNIVLRYSLQEQPKMILKDLRKLLKVSRIG